MEVEIITEVLTDGSKVYNTQITDEHNNSLCLGAVDEDDAETFATMFRALVRRYTVEVID